MFFVCAFFGAFSFAKKDLTREIFSDKAYTAHAAGIEKVYRFPQGVRVCGVDVSGKEKSEAFALVRGEEERRIPPFYADTWRGTEVFFPCEIGFTDDLEEIFLGAKRGESYECTMRCYLKGEGKGRLFSALRKEKKDARIYFSAEGFSYEKDEDGLTFDEAKAEEALTLALSSLTLGEHGWEFPRFSVETHAEKAEFTLQDAVRASKKIESFSTMYALSNAGRSKNIALAAESLDGYTLEGGEELSFNGVVGERTANRGYCEAKIIQDGEFVFGVGGGVCQVSTTLFNAALLSGLTVTERRAHSLAVSYVDASRDAMVSSASDLKIKNPYSYPVYLSMKCKNGEICATFYGKKPKRTYALESRVTEKILPPKAEERRLTAEESEKFYGTKEWEAGVVWLRKERCGAKSVLYRSEYENGKLVKRTRLFSDRYSSVRGIAGIIAKKVDDTSKIFPLNVCLFRKKML